MLPAPGVTLWEASAGTGKTYSIASTCLRLVAEEGLTIDRILVVTFTNAATSELRERVRLRLREARDAFATVLAGLTVDVRDDAVLQHLLVDVVIHGATRHDRLRVAVERFDEAAISTMHGFCQRVLREHAFACGAELGADLVGTSPELVDEIVHDFWDAAVSTRPVNAVRALRDNAGIDLDALRDIATKATRDPDAPIEPPSSGPRTDLDAVCAEHDARRDAYAAMWLAEHGAFGAEIREARTAKRLSGQSWQERFLVGRIDKMLRWAEAPDDDALPDPFRKYFVPDALSANGSPAVMHPLREAGGDLLSAMIEQERCIAEEAIALKHACATYARRELASRLRARRELTYDDLLRHLRAALRDPQQGPDLRSALRVAYDVALIDEFQDTDAVQWEIFRTLFEEPPHRLVLIGDPKQAIYGFRGADVYAYLRARASAHTHESLATNWRSDGGYVDAINHLFGRHAQPFGVADIAYAPVGATKPTRLTGAGAPFEVRVFARGAQLAGGSASGADVPSKDTVGACIPRLVAADVVRFLESGACIEEQAGAPRRVRPSDVAILVRKNAQALAVQRALRAAGVPSVLRGAASVFASREALELEVVLRAVLDPSSAARVRAALATELLGLAAAAELDGGASLGAGDALIRLDADDSAIDRWHERFRAWRARWEGTRGTRRSAGIAVLLRALLDELSLPGRLLALEDGERRLTNLLHLGELLHAEETERAAEPARLALWLREQIADPSTEDDARQLRLETDADAAQIVTMHASKGLEYPVVWCPYLWDGALAFESDKRHPYYRDADDDDVPVRKLHVAADKGGEECARLDDDQFLENLRLLYVALTRARHRCVVWWGAVSQCGTSPLGWLLHGESADDARVARAACNTALHKSISDDIVRARVEEIAAGASDAIAVISETFAPPTRWRPEVAPRPSLAARSYGRAAPIDDGWRFGSFTGLTRSAAARAEEIVGAPESMGDARDAGESTAADGVLVPLADFPASADAGIFFHAVLEQHDFESASTLPTLVAERLAAHGFDASRWAAPVTDAVQRLLDEPIAVEGAAPLRLRDVPKHRRLVELRFDLPVCGGLAANVPDAVTAGALGRAFADHPGGSVGDAALAAYATRVGALGFRPLRGFLTGALDLVVEHDQRWWVIDWKSNRLGRHAADYAADRLVDEMTESHYVLQYHLYLVAMHRWLGTRLPRYDYDTHIGGACYPFLRGVGAAPGGGAGTHGVFVDRPPRARIEALDRLLAVGA